MLGVLIGIVHPARRAQHQNPPPPLAVLAPAAHPDFLRSGGAWSVEEIQRLRSDVAPIVNATAFPPTSSAIVVDARDGRVLYEHNANTPLIPGSTIKLITASAALEALGPSYRFVTSIVSDGTLAGAQLNGDVWLLGGGDPELTSDDLRRGTHAIARRGIAQITGNVYADGSRYGDDAVNTSWLPEDLQYGWAAPASAISIDGGSV
ncbi:MAG: D-alanyl-D-alanine carboxypeptidase/D-alanyl-D-alanine-endopeptidase, partial [Candidatus Eremiobacteraeota bacterium]|nr:D-alanyl-D-alanine carboxypeptidase/D-alanyl-D-alanine-endopeptidase [Candidatus Eremiobacteraeota bacterium]